MNTEILSAKELLQQVESGLPNAERDAEAEKSFGAACPEKNNPWHGASDRYATVLQQRDGLRRQAQGEKLNRALAELEQLDAVLAQATARRATADATMASMQTHPVVIRWNQSGYVSMQHGCGMTWEILRPWIVSCKSRAYAPIQAQALDGAEWPDALRYSDAEREIIARFLKAKDVADKALSEQNALQSRRAALLRECPELLSVKRVA
jgi:hypothetical protein